MNEAIFAQGGAAALLACGAAVLVRGQARVHATACMLSAGIAATAIALTLRWIAAGQGPFLTLYEVVLSTVFSLALVCALAWARWPALRRGAPFALGFIALLALWSLWLPREVTPLPPSFRHPWLWVHVLAGKLFLGALLVACGVAAHLLMTRPAPGAARPLESELWRFAALAFVFDSGMLVAGAVWARDAWGRYWAWDPLETSALLTWLVLALLLHLRAALRLPPRLGWMLLIGVFALAVLTFLGLPFLSLGPHKGFL